jgi:hypothetical protein
MTYITLVHNWTVQGKSHLISDHPELGSIWTKCGRWHDYYSTNVVVTDVPESKGVCKLCERKNA